MNTWYMKAVSLVEKIHKTPQWLQNLQFVTEMFYQNGKMFICLNKGTEEREPILLSDTQNVALHQILHIEVD